MDLKDLTFEEYIKLVAPNNLDEAMSLQCYKEAFIRFKTIANRTEIMRNNDQFLISSDTTNKSIFKPLLKDNSHLYTTKELDLISIEDPLHKTRNEVQEYYTDIVKVDDLKSEYMKTQYMAKLYEQPKLNYANHAVCMFCNATLDHGEQCDCEEAKRRKEHITNQY